MDLTVFLAMLGSAFLHALWHAAGRTRPDPSRSLMGVVVAAGFWGLVTMLIVGFPPLSILPWLAIALIFNITTFMLLMAAYERTAFFVAYPASRAGIPPMVLVFALLFFRELPSALALIGIALIVVSMVALALAFSREQKTSLAGLGFALASAAANAAYALIDAWVVRSGTNSLAYAGAASLCNAMGFAIIYAWRGQRPMEILRAEPIFTFTFSLASTVSYLLFVWSMQYAPLAIVSSIRETSVLFSVAIAAIWLKERVKPVHWLAGVLATLGIALFRLS